MFYGKSTNTHFEKDLKDTSILTKIFLVLSFIAPVVGIILFNNIGLFLICLGLGFIFITLTCMTAMKSYKNIVLWSLFSVGIILDLIGLGLMLSITYPEIFERIFLIFCFLLGISIFPVIGIIILINGYKNLNKKTDNPKDANFLIKFGWFWLIFSLVMEGGILFLISCIENQSIIDTFNNFIYLF